MKNKSKLPPLASNIPLLLTSLAVFLAFSMPCNSIWAQEVKHLKRIPPIGGTPQYHRCQIERIYRMEDTMASLSEEQLLALKKQAAKGDAEAMYILAQHITETPEGKRDYRDEEEWLPKAAEAGHPIAKYRLEMRRDLREEYARQKAGLPPIPPSPERINALLEWGRSAAEADPGGDWTWLLGLANEGRWTFAIAEYKHVKADPAQALLWLRLAAERGHPVAAERLCDAYGNNGHPFLGIPENHPDNPKEAVRWCMQVAQADCSTRGASRVAGLYEHGFGLPKSDQHTKYWRRIAQERFDRWLAQSRQGQLGEYVVERK